MIRVDIVETWDSRADRSQRVQITGSQQPDDQETAIEMLCKKRDAGFTLIELLVVIAIIVLLIAIIVPSLDKARDLAMMIVCQSNERQLITSQQAYGCDNRDRIGALNWEPGKGNSLDPDLNPKKTDKWVLCQGMQACDIARRRTGRDLPLVNNRFFNRNFWHLPLIDGGYYGSTNLIVPAFACPKDLWVKKWQQSPTDFNALKGTMPEPTADPPNTYEWYRPFWSTYQLVPVAFAPDKHSSGSRTLTQYLDRHHLLDDHGENPPLLPLGKRRFDEVAFPSQKVFIFDIFARHGRKVPIWHSYPVAKAPLMFFDGSNRVLRTRDADQGWNPDYPTSTAPTVYTYNPSTGFPGYDYPTLSGNESDKVKGYFRWTRGGLRGADFGLK